MGISAYLKDIGRGKQGARALTREQACDLMGQVLDGQVSDLEVGAFCLAMRIKGETAGEMAGFLDATHTRLQAVAAGTAPTVVLPSYNGARKLPVLTPLLALLLAQQGLRVVVHGCATENNRVTSTAVFEQLAAWGTEGLVLAKQPALVPAGPGVAHLPTAALLPALQRLLDVRRVVGLRNPAHSLVKLLNPCTGPCLLVTSYTHPEYLESMGAVLALTGQAALLLRGTEGEAVADPRRTPAMNLHIHRCVERLQEAVVGSLAKHDMPDLPEGTAAADTALYTQMVLAGERPVPGPIAQQVRHIRTHIERALTPHPSEATT